MTNDVDALLKGISQLKSRLLYYGQHHRHCGIEKQPSPLDEERNSIHASQADYLSDALSTTNNLHTITNAAKGFEIVVFDPSSIRDIEPRSERTSLQRDPQWRTVANQYWSALRSPTISRLMPSCDPLFHHVTKCLSAHFVVFVKP